MRHKRTPNNLRRFRRERGLSQKDVAAILGIKSSSMVSRWEKGVTLPETLNALKMAALYRSAVDVIYDDLRLGLIDEIARRERVITKSTGRHHD
jgi:transcriptional regulator with XRE-family HTH domain